jgi:hypothetical protein
VLGVLYLGHTAEALREEPYLLVELLVVSEPLLADDGSTIN